MTTLESALRAADLHIPDAAGVIRERIEKLEDLLSQADTALGALQIEAAMERWPKTASQGTVLAYTQKARFNIGKLNGGFLSD